MAIPSKKPASPSNSYMGRVKATSVAPPQTVLHIKRRLCKIENIVNYSGSKLFLSKLKKSQENDEYRVSILTPGGLGSTPNNPIELVVELSVSEEVVINKLIANARRSLPEFSTRTMFINPYCTLTPSYPQYTIVSTQKMGQFRLRTLSILMPMTARLSHASI